MMSETAQGVIGSLNGKVLFTRRPAYVPVAARLPWRLTLICLVLSRFRNSSARIEHLHLVHWALTTPKTRQQLKVWLDGIRPMDTATVRLDPALGSTLSIAHAEGIVSVLASRKISLTDVGARLVAEIEQQTELLLVEKEYLSSLGPLTEAGLTRQLGAISG